jgi:hypothetical protein
MPDTDASANGGGTAVKLGRKDFQSDQDVRWCPGCGDYSILAQTQRVMPDLMGLKSVLVINDEAHHCYRHKATPEVLNGEEDLDAEEKDEAEKNSEAARLWITS